MNATTVAVDLAKNDFELAVAELTGRVVERRRLSRTTFARFFVNRPACHIVMEACGSAHHWARVFAAQGHAVQLLPAQYVRAYVRRNKTDRADASALLEAARCPDIQSVPVKSLAQQAILQLHRVRSQWMRTRTARINALRGCLREFGVAIPLGAGRGMARIREQLALSDNAVPEVLRPIVFDVLTEIRELETRVLACERQITALTREDPVIAQLLEIPGIGPLTATAMRAAVVDVQRFRSGRHLASWIGLTAREHSSGSSRHLGRIDKRGDGYLRTLLIHGARAVLLAAKVALARGRPLDRLRTWALEVQARRGHNKATVALANKLARIAWVTWKHQRPFDGNWALAH
jgi:transposase